MALKGISKRDILILDNNSGDDSVEKMAMKLPGIRIIEASHNGGFGAGVNFGMRHVSAKYALVLNPDTLFISDIVDNVIGLFENDETIGIVGLNLLNPDLSPQYSARRFYSYLDILVRRTRLQSIWPWSWLNDRHLMKKELASGSVFSTDWVLGTGFAVRKALYDSLQGMDEGYFLYMEDVDLCARVWAAEYRVVCSPAAAIIHDHQRASAQSLTSPASRIHLKSLKRFATKFNIPMFYVRNRMHVLRT